MSLNRFSSICFGGISVFLLQIATLMSAQAASPLRSTSIQQVLAGVRSNIDTMIATLPDVSCSEQVHSAYLHKGKVKNEVTLESVLQAKRMNAKTWGFTEERTSIHPLSINGKPPGDAEKYTIPYSVTNGFGITYKEFLSPEFEPCHVYKLVPSAGTNWIDLEVTQKKNSKETASCGKMDTTMVSTFWIDPNSYQIRRVNIVMPKTMLNSGNSHVLSYTVGTIDYGSVLLGQKSYLLPSKVHAAAWQKYMGSPNQLVYDAAYSNCHIFISSSHIITDPTAIVQ